MKWAVIIVVIICLFWYYNKQQPSVSIVCRPPSIIKHNFWTGVDDVTHHFFEKLFKGLEICQDINIYATFPVGTPHPVTKRITVQFSGEAYCYEHYEAFDLNLIMRPMDLNRGVITFTLFAMECQSRNLWPLLCQSRDVTLSDKTDFCAFVVSNGACSTRNRFFEKLCDYKRVESSGGYMNNVGFSAPRGEAYFAFLRKYKFMICFENTSQPEYLTEKLLWAYLGGTIPIYWGASKAKEWLNDRAFLQLTDNSDESMNALIERIKELDQNPDAYSAMLREPLLRDGIPESMDPSTLRSNIVSVLREKRPDVFR